MRIRLVGAGAAVAVVGVGLVISLFFLPAPPTDTRSSSVAIANLGANATHTWTMSEEATDSGSLSLSWTASGAASVGLYAATPCSVGGGTCPAGQPIVRWNSNVTGVWSFQGALQTGYFLSVTSLVNTPVSFTGTLTETYPVPTASEVVPTWALIAVGGLFLLGIGGTALFLGFFLASDVYAPPRSGFDRFDPGGDDGSELPPTGSGTDEL